MTGNRWLMTTSELGLWKVFLLLLPSFKVSIFIPYCSGGWNASLRDLEEEKCSLKVFLMGRSEGLRP